MIHRKKPDESHPDSGSLAGAAEQDTEESLLEQIRIKEDELHSAIEQAEKDADTRIANARIESAGIMKKQQEDVREEVNRRMEAVAQEVQREAGRLQEEGEKARERDLERKNTNMEAAVDTVLREILAR